MHQLTAAGRAELAGDHTLATKVQVLHGGLPVYELAVYDPEDQHADRGRVTDCQVDTKAGEPILRSCSLSLFDPTGALTLTDAGELLSPYDAEVKPYRGVQLAEGQDMAPLGVFRLTNSDISDGPQGVTIDLTGQDRALTYMTPLPRSVSIPFGTPVETAIGRLLSTVFGGFSWVPWRTGASVGPLLYETDHQAWEQALILAESVGGWLFHDRNGVPQLSPYATNTQSATRVTGVLKVSKAEDADEIHNSVVMRSSNSSEGLVTATAEDEDPTSPTYVLGRFGRRQITVVNPHVGTPEQAQQAAVARLVEELGRSETVSWEQVPDPQIDVGDPMVLHRPRIGLLDRRVVVEATSLSLGVTSSMSVTGRRSVVGADGAVVG